MVVALTQRPDNSCAVLDKDKLHLEVKLSVTLGITAEQAKRKLARFLMDEVSLLISPQLPLLVVVDQHTIFWRFPIIFSMGPRGRLGQVGEIDIDALTGELLLNENQLSEIKTHARLLAQSPALSANN